MAIEIERKFLVDASRWTAPSTGIRIRQGYICASPDRTVRVRTLDDRAVVTIKGPVVGISRLEFEYAVPLADATTILDELCVAVLDKTRYRVPFEGFVWEVDVFHGENDGLITAEVELEAESDTPQLPPWVGEDVTTDRRYRNSVLAREPYGKWGSKRT